MDGVIEIASNAKQAMMRGAIIVAILAVAGWYAMTFLHPAVRAPTSSDAGSLHAPLPPPKSPAPGERIRFHLPSGATREGVVCRADADTVTIETEHGEVTYSRDAMTRDHRRAGLSIDADTGARPAVSPLPGVPSNALLFGSNVQYVIAGTNIIVIYAQPDAIPAEAAGRTIAP